MTRLGKPPLTRTIALACAFGLLVTTAAWWLFLGADSKRVVAYFDSAVGLYEGGEVRVLGVRVGEIRTVTPEPKQVKVEMTVRREVDVPADAGAVVISPSVVSGRFVQLAPVYRGGPTMDDGAVIPNKRTVTPVEIDQIYRSLNELTSSLGPKGANKNGALSRLLEVGAANLQGNGKLLSQTLRNLGQAGTTLAGSSEDLFATVDKLQKLTSTLASNDDQVRRFNEQMREVNELLAGQRDDLGNALAELAVALGKVESFVRENREKLSSNVEQLGDVAKVLVKQEKALAGFLTTGPLALGNVQNAYNAASGTLDTRANINELNTPPLMLVCKLLAKQAPPEGLELPDTVVNACGTLNKSLGLDKLPTAAETISAMQHGKLPKMPLPLSDTLGVPRQGGGS